MFDAIGRKLFSSGFKTAMSSGVNSAIANKVVDAVVNGATSTPQKVGKTVVKGTASAGQKAAESAVNNAIDSTKKWFVGRTRSIQPSLSVGEPIIIPPKRKLDIYLLFYLWIFLLEKTTMPWLGRKI